MINNSVWKYIWSITKWIILWDIWRSFFWVLVGHISQKYLIGHITGSCHQFCTLGTNPTPTQCVNKLYKEQVKWVRGTNYGYVPTQSSSTTPPPSPPLAQHLNSTMTWECIIPCKLHWQVGGNELREFFNFNFFSKWLFFFFVVNTIWLNYLYINKFVWNWFSWWVDE